MCLNSPSHGLALLKAGAKLRKLFGMSKLFENISEPLILGSVKRAGTVQPSLFLLKFPSVQQHEEFPGIAHRHQHPGKQVEFRQTPAGVDRENRSQLLFPRSDPGGNKNLR